MYGRSVMLLIGKKSAEFLAAQLGGRIDADTQRAKMMGIRRR